MSQVERLQTLLERVQRNRVQPRDRGWQAGAPEEEPDTRSLRREPQMLREVSEVPGPVFLDEARAQAAPRPGMDASGLANATRGAAVQDRGTMPTHRDPQDWRDDHEPNGVELDRESVAPPGASAHYGRASSPPPRTGDGGQGPMPESIEVPAPVEPQRPIAQVVNKAPGAVPPTFGELLRRSLALRPR